MKIIWSPLAIRRLLEASHYIARDKAGAAAQWAESVFEAVDQLSEFPRRGRIVPEVRRSDIRELWVGEYRVVHRVEEERVIILTVRHGRRPLDLDEVE